MLREVAASPELLCQFRMRRSSARGSVASHVLGADPRRSVVGVSEVEWFAGLDWCTAAGAWDWACAEDGRPACPLYLVCVPVASLGCGPACALVFALMFSASGLAIGEDDWASSCTASSAGHVSSGHEEGHRA